MPNLYIRDVDSSVLWQAKLLAMQRHLTLKTLVTEAINAYLQHNGAEGREGDAVRVDGGPAKVERPRQRRVRSGDGAQPDEALLQSSTMDGGAPTDPEGKSIGKVSGDRYNDWLKTRTKGNGTV